MSIEQLAAKIAAIPVNHRGHRIYGKSLKLEIMAALPKSGLTHKEFAERVGVPAANLCHWREHRGALPSVAAVSRFKELVIEADRSSERLILRAPGGAVIEGLSIADAADLLIALAARSPC